jgi:fumarate reductase subunit C
VTAARYETLLWLLQRASAAVLAVCVAVHLVTIVLAVRGGLSAAEILARTRGSAAWAAFYAVFVLAVAIHAPIGLRTIAREAAGWRGAGLEIATLALGAALGLIGWRAVAGLVAA